MVTADNLFFLLIWHQLIRLGFPSGSDSKESACNTGDTCSVPESRRSPGEGKGNTLQYSYLENSMDRGHGGLESMRLQRVGHD